MKVTDEMVNRFLSWSIPRSFSPDCGISFDGRKDDEWNKNKSWPVGTNVFSADEARQMLEHVLAEVFREGIVSEPAAQDLMYLWDSGTGPAIALYKDGIVKIGMADGSFTTTIAGWYDMMRYYSAAGFKLTPPSQEMLDAQRYRFLRDTAMKMDDAPSVVSGASGEFDFLEGPDVDEAVDEAMADRMASEQSSTGTA